MELLELKIVHFDNFLHLFTLEKKNINKNQLQPKSLHAGKKMFSCFSPLSVDPHQVTLFSQGWQFHPLLFSLEWIVTLGLRRWHGPGLSFHIIINLEHIMCKNYLTVHIFFFWFSKSNVSRYRFRKVSKNLDKMIHLSCTISKHFLPC